MGGRSPSDEKSLFLVGVLDTHSTQCVAKADPGGALIARGVLDLGITAGYSASLLVGNQATPAAVGAGTSAERVELSTALVDLTAADGTPLLSYQTTISGFVDPGSADSPGYGAVVASLISPELGQEEPVKSAHDVVANVRLRGVTPSGTKLTTSSLAFPITVCTGCLVQYPPSAADPSQVAGSTYQCASSTVEPPGAATAAPCVLGQDMAFSCELCADTVPICRDPMLNPSYF